MMDKKLTLASILVVGLVLQVGLTASTINTKNDAKLASERLLANRLKRAWTLQEALIQEQRARRNTNSFIRSVMKRTASYDANSQDDNNDGDDQNPAGFAWSGGTANSNNK